MAASNDAVAGLLTSVSERRVRSDREMVDEFQSGTDWLAATISSCKRKVLESAGLAVDDVSSNPKKVKMEAGPTSAAADAGKENGHPNLSAPSAASISKPDSGKAEPPAKSADIELPHHPDDDIDVMGMKVTDLRKELRSRGLETVGLKKELQKRLAGAIDEAREDLRKAVAASMDAAAEAEAEKEKERLAAQRQQREEELKRKEEEERRQAVKEMDREDHLATEATAAMDFPGVNVDSLKAGEENISQQGDIETKSDNTARAEDRNEGPGEDKPTEKPELAVKVTTNENSEDVEMQDTAAGDMDDATDSPSSSEYDDLRDDTPDTKEDEDMKEEEPAPAESTAEGNADVDMMSPSKSPKKKNIGKKLMKATTKLFSPTKKKEKSPVKQPTKQASQEDNDIMPPPPPLTSALKQRPVGPSSQSVARAESVKKVKLPESSSSSLLKTPAVGPKPAFSKSTETKRKAVEEARKKRLAELRGKSKPVQLTQSQKAKLATADPSALRKATSKNALKQKSKASDQSVGSVASSSSSSVASVASSKASAQEKQKAEKRKMLAAQMREKAAAAKAQKKVGNIKQPETKSAAPAAQRVAAIKNRFQEQHNATQQPQRIAQPVAPQSPAKPPPPQKQPEVLSPMDTYEMSDRGSDSSESDDSDSEDECSPKKRVPKWAQRSNLIPALEKQFADGPERVDPDDIFPEVSTCDLTMIFDKKKARYQKRTSSGNWTKDRVTVQEKLVYKRTMGFAK